MAMPFDLAGLEVTGDPPVPLAEQVMEIEGAQYTFSASGLLAYLPDNPRWQERRLVWVDREGSIEPLAAPPRPYVYGPRISPDGRQVAVHIEGASWGHLGVRFCSGHADTPHLGGEQPVSGLDS